MSDKDVETDSPSRHSEDGVDEKPAVYLAGPVRDVEDNGRGWREHVIDEWANTFDFLNPLDKYEPGKAMQTPMTDEELVAGDLEMIADADAMLVCMPDTGIETWGTPMEMVYASERYGIPTAVAWMADNQCSPWVQTHANVVAPHPDYALEYLSGLLTGSYTTKVLPPHDRVKKFNPAKRGVVDETGTDRLDGKVAGLEHAYQSVAEDRDCAGEDDSTEGGDDESILDTLTATDLTGDEKARALLSDVAALVHSDRDTHGDAVVNQQHIGDGWTWYLRGLGKLDADERITGGDVGRMMGLLKMSRTAVGDYDVDHDRDVAGYAGIAAACEVDNGTADVEELTVEDLGEHA